MSSQTVPIRPTFDSSKRRSPKILEKSRHIEKKVFLMGNFLPNGSYQKTSRNVRATLYCQAQKKDGSWIPASLDLTHLVEPNVVNENGHLHDQAGNVKRNGYLPGGSYHASTQSQCVILSALCKAGKHDWLWSTLDITNFSLTATLSNINGTLHVDPNSTN